MVYIFTVWKEYYKTKTVCIGLLLYFHGFDQENYETNIFHDYIYYRVDDDFRFTLMPAMLESVCYVFNYTCFKCLLSIIVTLVLF